MNNTITLDTKSKILQLRNSLGIIANCSFSFSKINRDYPLDNLGEEEGKKIIQFYKDLITEADRALEPYRREQKA